MADKKITQLDELAGVDLDDADDFVVRDTSTSVTKKIKKSGLLTGLFKNLLTTDGDILTRSGGVPARITRANLFADPAATSRYLPWQANTAYTAGTFVSNAGSLYTVNSNFTSPSTFSTTGLTLFSSGGSSTPEIEDWTVLGNLGATETITGAANIVRRRIGTLDQACTVTIATSANQQLDVILVQDATGGRAVTFAGVDVWVTSTRAAPSTAATTATSLDRFRFENIAGTCYGYWLTEPIVATPLASTRYRKSGKYYSCDGRTTGTTALTASRLLYARFETYEAITLDRIGVSVTVAGAASVIRLGIYNDDGDGHPGTKLLDAGTVDSTATGDLEITISQALPIGVYWLCAVAQGGTPTIRTWAAGNDTQWIGVASTAIAAQNDPLSYNQASVSGALPSTATPVGENRTLPRIWVRLA